jgi:RNA polymerase sigma-70 factor (ECF subfamily)
MGQLPETRHSLLLRLAEPNDSTAWVEFLGTYEGAVMRYCRSRGLQEPDARDVVQEVLLAVHQAMHSWQPTGRAGGFRAWLIRTTHNMCLKSLRAQARGDRGLGGSSVRAVFHERSASSKQDHDLEEDVEWQRWAFYWAANEVECEVLPATWQAFWQTAVDGQPAAEVARRLEMRVGSVYAAKCRVLSRLRERIQQLLRDE